MGTTSGGGGPQPRPVTVKKSAYEFRVKPGLFRVAAAYGERPDVEFQNQTEFEVQFWFPDDVMLIDDAPAPRPVTVPPGGAKQAKVNVACTQVDTVREYEVRVMLKGGLYIEATGGSRPEIEIKP